MSSERIGAGIPAPERAVVGLCHDLNDQLAAVSAYVFLLKRRGLLGDMVEPLQEHLDRLAHGVRMVRSLARSPTPHVGPVSVSLLAEAASDAMRSYPDGSVRFVVPQEDEGAAVVHCDWNDGLRYLLSGAAWIRRGLDPEATVDVEIRKGDSAESVVLTVLGDPPRPDSPDAAHDPCTEATRLVRTGPRSIRVLLDAG